MEISSIIGVLDQIRLLIERYPVVLKLIFTCILCVVILVIICKCCFAFGRRGGPDGDINHEKRHSTIKRSEEAEGGRLMVLSTARVEAGDEQISPEVSNNAPCKAPRTGGGGGGILTKD